MATTPERKTIDDVLVIEREHWQDGPPNELFRELRGRCPVHWSETIPEYPQEDGFWSVTTGDDIHAVSRDWEAYSSASGITSLTHALLALEMQQAMFIG